MKLAGMSISNFKCFLSTTINNLKDINVFIGKNNAGKSSILEALEYSSENRQIPKEFWRLSDEPKEPGITVVFELSSKEQENLFDIMPYDKTDEYQKLINHIKDVCGEPLEIKVISLPGKNNIYDFRLKKKSSSKFTLSIQSKRYQETLSISGVMSRLSSQDIFNEKVFPKPHFIKCKAVRKMEEQYNLLFRDKNSDKYEQTQIFSEAQGIIKDLSPDELYFDIHSIDTDEKKDIREVHFTTHDKMEERINLPLGGTGNDELIYMVYKIINGRGHILGIEEPEIHIHPELQKRLFEFLKREATQYKSTFLITTHSNIFLNENNNGSSYLIKLVSDKTAECEQIDQNKFIDVLDEIGLTFSDIYLANGMLFVEGKNDKEAIKKWSVSLLNKDIESLGIKIIIMNGARNATYFAESEVLKNFSTISIKAPFLILIDRDEKSENDIKRLRRNFGNNIRVLSKREFENYLVKKEILIGYIKENYSDYFSSKKKSELNSLIETKLEQSCEQLKKLSLTLNFLKKLSDDLYIHSVKIFSRYKSEEIWQLIKDKEEEKLFPFVVEEIVGKENFGNIFSKEFKEKYCKKIWESEKNSFDKNWRKWKLIDKLSTVPGKELIKVIRKKIDIPNFQINENLLIDFISENKSMIPKEFERIIKKFSLE